MNGIPSFLTPLDWAVVSGYFALVTLVAWRARSGSPSGGDRFAACRSLPWPAVALSIAVTEIGVLAFLVVPGAMVALESDVTILQWILGSLVARAIVGIFFVNRYFEGDARTPFDVVESGLGSGGRRLAKLLFALGGLLAQAARLVVAAIPLSLLTALPYGGCLAFVVACAVLWTIIGGMRSVVWTDAVHFFTVLVAGLAALFWVMEGTDGGWRELHDTVLATERFDGGAVDKLKLFDFRLDPSVDFTFWVALFAVPFLQITALGADPTGAQPLFCCRNPQAARKAILWSSLGQLLVLIMVVVGLAIFAFYRLHPPTDPMILTALKWSGGGAGEAALVFPVWAVTELPPAIRGLVLAGILASAVAGLSSFLGAAACSFRVRRADVDELMDRSKPQLPRSLVAVFGVSVGVIALLLFDLREGAPMRVPTHFAGPLFAVFVASLARRGRVGGLIFGTLLSLLLAALARGDLNALTHDGNLGRVLGWLEREMDFGSFEALGSLLDSPWMWPLTALLTLACGWDFRSKKLRKF